MAEKLDYFLKIEKIPNIIIYGGAGSGKKTLVNNFLNKIYTKEEKEKYLLEINCGGGMGIKLIREDLKFFGKLVIAKDLFKTVVLYNGDKLTTDAQCALRRCIEVFSKNTRFIIIIEDKNKLLKPLLSRFCDIYISNSNNYYKTASFKKSHIFIEKNISNDNLFELTELLYNNGYHIFDLIQYFTLNSIDENKHFYLMIL